MLLNILTYIHPVRTYLPCTGIGRHMNQILLGLSGREEIELKLLFSSRWLGKDRLLPPVSPLRHMPFVGFPMEENSTERSWKMFGYPKMDSFIPAGTDWIYAPMETYIPVSKCPVAITLHDIQAFDMSLPWSGSWQHRLARYKWSTWIYRTLADCRIIFTVSEFSKNQIVQLLGGNPAKIVVAGNGVEQAYFDVAGISPESLKLPFDMPYMLVIGGLRMKKGAACILQLARRLLQAQSKFRILVAGASEQAYINQAKELPNIEVLGVVAEEVLPRLLRGASSLLFLSLYEGFGIPAIEAMAAGVPVVATGGSALPEIIGDAGILVNPADSEGIMDIVEELERNSQMREYYIGKGQRRAQEYRWEYAVEKVQRAFHEFA